MSSISKGDTVHWNTSQGRTTGTAKEKHTQPFQHDKQKFNASADDPYWVVESEKTGATAAHKESSLSKGRAQPWRYWSHERAGAPA